MDEYVLEYLRGEIRQSALDDVVAVARFHARRHNDDRGHFSTPREVFCYVDHLGFLAYGDSSSASAVRFIREHFPPRYEGLADLVHAMWRHGTVHQFRPFGYIAHRAEGEPLQVWWLSTNHDRKAERAQHLLVFPVPKVANAVYLVMNCCQLADDLVLGIDRFIERIEAGEFDSVPLMARYSAVRRPQDVDQLKSSAKFKVEIRDQIELAHHNQGGRLDRHLTVVEPHPEVVA